MKPKHITKTKATKVLANIGEELIYFKPIIDDDSFCNPSSFVNNYVLRQVNQIWPDKSKAEVSAIKFAQKIGVPVPKIYYYDDKHILMEKAKGERLDKIWDSISSKEKKSYMKHMIKIVENMHQHKSKQIGSLFGEEIGKCIDTQKGPYKDFKEFYLSDYDKRVKYITHPIKKEFVNLREKISENLNFELDSVFSHQDLGLKNIFGKNSKITCIIDWEWGGFFPEIYDFKELENWCDKEMLKQSKLHKEYPQKLLDYFQLSSLAMRFAYYKEWNIKDEEKYVKELEKEAAKLFSKIK